MNTFIFIDPVQGFMFFNKDKFQKSKWAKLHDKDYHPKVDGIVERVEEFKKQDKWIVDEWEKFFGIKIPVKDKVIMEIGFGGGWYLAQMLYKNAAKVIGIEIHDSIIQRARQAFDKLGLSNYEFLEIDERYFKDISEKSVDVIFEITVFQHILKNLTVTYLQESKRILKEDGIFIAQFLMNDYNPIKSPSTKKEGIMYYSHDEILEMIKQSGFTVDKFADYEWSDGKGSYWRIYLLKQSHSL
jgi:cyclopropane fatty-acyl-phospholipid synthase-like methyltransferase